MEENNCQRLMNLKGIGPKTIDYLSLLVGIPTIPIDRHMINFLRLGEVDISILGYSEMKNILHGAAFALNVPIDDLDFQIWNFMQQVRV